MPLFFEQQPKESAKAFAAFKTYLELGEQRSLSSVAEQHGKSKTMMEKWSRRFDWPARIQAHGAHIAEVERMAIEKLAIEKAVEWHNLHENVKREAWKEAEETIAMVRKARAEWIAKGRVPGWEGMARMLELAFKLKQFAAGMNVDEKKNANEPPQVRVEVLVALEKIYGQAELGSNLANEPVPEIIDVEATKIGGQG
jgi:hypothetical protein